MNSSIYCVLKRLRKLTGERFFSDKQQEDCLRRASRSGEHGFRRVHTVSKYICRHCLVRSLCFSFVGGRVPVVWHIDMGNFSLSSITVYYKYKQDA